MKKFLRNCAAFVLMVAMTATMAGMAYANENISVTVEGQRVAFIDQAPVIVNGRTLVPVRGVFEQLGFTVNWNNDVRQVTLTNSDYNVVLTVGSTTFTTNGATHTLDVPAQIIGGRTMLPIRAVLESIGYYIGWNSSTSTVLISVESIPEQPVTTPATVEFDMERLRVTDERLAEMVATGIIPADVTVLRLTGNQITDLTPLRGLTNLTELYLSHNQINRNPRITDLTPLSGLTNLTVLRLSFSLASSDLMPLSLTPLSGLTNLTELDLSFNRLTDITPLSSLTNLKVLYLTGNPLNDSGWSILEHIELDRLNGVWLDEFNREGDGYGWR